MKDSTMCINKISTLKTTYVSGLIALNAILLGCATNSNSSSTSNDTSSTNKSTGAATAKDNSKAQQKISMAIGQEVSDFSIVSQINTDAPMGYVGTQYTVQTKKGKTYKCDILENSGFGKVMTFGTGTGAGAMCTDFTKGSKDAGKTNAASCNALLKAAGKC